MLGLLSLLLFGGLISGGIAVQAGENPTPRVEVKPAPPANRVARPQMRDRIDFLARYLGLTDAQKEKIRPIFAEEAKQIADLRKETTMPLEEKRAKYNKIRETTNAKLKEVPDSRAMGKVLQSRQASSDPACRFTAAGSSGQVARQRSVGKSARATLKSRDTSRTFYAP